MVWVWMGGIIVRLIFKINISKNGVFYITLLEYSVEKKIMEYWPNGVAMGRYGPILWENGATGSGKVFRCLWGLREAIF